MKTMIKTHDRQSLVEANFSWQLNEATIDNKFITRAHFPNRENYLVLYYTYNTCGQIDRHLVARDVNKNAERQ